MGGDSAALLLGCISVLVIRARRRYPYLPVGWFWYLGTLVPVIGLVQAGEQAMADRFAYVPLIGLFVMISWGVFDIAAGWRCRRLVLGISTGVAFAALMVCTWLQVGYWHNNITITL